MWTFIYAKFDLWVSIELYSGYLEKGFEVNLTNIEAMLKIKNL